MRRLTYFGAALVCALTVGTSPATAHNAGCVVTGNDKVVTVGSGKSGPSVPESNPHYHVGVENESENYGRLDLVAADDPASDGDQYGARFAADQNSTVLTPKECAER